MLFVEKTPAESPMAALLDWAALGYSLTGTVASEKQALAVIETERPDVVVTELALAEGSGLSLIRRAKAAAADTAFVILAPEGHFEAAQEAITLGVSAFLTRPEDPAVLRRTFVQLHQTLQQRNVQAANWTALQQFYKQSLPVMQASFYAALIDGQIDRSSLHTYQRDYQIDLPGPYYTVLVVHTSTKQLPAGADPMLVRTQVLEKSRTFFATLWSAAAFSYLGNTVLVVQLGNTAAGRTLTDDADRFCQEVKAQLEAYVTVGVGTVVADPLDLPQAYRSARTAVSYRSLYGSGKVINMKELVPEERDDFSPVADTALAALLKQIHLGPATAIEGAVATYLAYLETTATGMNQHTVVVNELISSLYRFAANNRLRVAGLTDNLKGLYQSLPENSPASLHQWLSATSLALHRQLAAARDTTSTTMMREAKAYVRAHYQEEELGLKDICAALGVSSSYFSTLFKRETGVSFITYLTDFRMNLAARLLLETTEKSQVIGHLCGYADPNYFSLVFKKHFGDSPTAYRGGAVAMMH
ncbi:hypothetical protein L248_0081 [Schleiferilactobacillus shenzhenensis LY-73]|uniref:Uncharacterized protein n=1 Tax=Schleiferilactobacillus shenzhenensis LY-73 TaxID=1231336 RepID=U4TYL8_9LACO|nr:hypothetical protein L248_0081 [Schleiferilactobacillus shenzhenensis LY-73]